MILYDSGRKGIAASVRFSNYLKNRGKSDFINLGFISIPAIARCADPLHKGNQVNALEEINDNTIRADTGMFPQTLWLLLKYKDCG